MKKFIICIGLVLVVGSLNGYSQVKKFGKVNRDAVTKTDTKAPAEVLFDYGVVRMNQNIEYELYRHVRVKINTEEGIERSTFELPFRANEGESITEIEGFSYSLNERGRIVKTRLSKASIKEEELAGSFKKLSLTLPNVKEGSVIEVRYKHVIGDPDNIPRWTFEDTIPVHWSEYKAELPVFHEFAILSKEDDDFHIKKTKSSYMKHRVNVGEYFGSTYGNSYYKDDFVVRVKSTKLRWVQKDIPAIGEGKPIESQLVLQYNGVYWVASDAYQQGPSRFGRNSFGGGSIVYTGPPSQSRFN